MLCRRAFPLLAALVVAAVGSPARADGTGTCTGMVTGTVGLSVPNRGGSLQSVSSSVLPYVFDNAECLCGTDDIHLEIALTAALPTGMLGTTEVWVGSGCDNYQVRTQVNQTACEKIVSTDVTAFTLGSTSGGNRIEFPISAAALTSPLVHTCTTTTASNSVWVFLYTDPMTPFATCKLQLNEANQGPAAPTNPSATSGDGAVTLSWSAPVTTTAAFQILCADANNGPVPGKFSDQAYSTCMPGPPLTIFRRALPTGGSISTGALDAGTNAVVDLGGLSVPYDDDYPLHPQAAPDDAGVAADMGTTTAAQHATQSGLPPPFDSLDPAFVCSGSLGPTATSARITGLTNGSSYQFVVLAIDLYGNATPSEVVTAEPQPVEDLYRRYYDSGGRAHGFCFIATAAWGSYEHRYVRVLREFRDRVLLPTASGAAFVAWYYAHSPPAADYIAAHKAARIATQIALWPLIGAAATWLYLAAWQKALLLALLGAWAWRRRSSRTLARGRRAPARRMTAA